MRLVPALLLSLALLFFAQVAGATSVSLIGNFSYQLAGPYVTLSTDKIVNNTVGGYSGTLRAELWAFPARYTGAIQPGYQLSTYVVGSLNGGMYFAGFSTGSISFAYPPNGIWYTSLLLTEYNNGTWPVNDYTNFSNEMVCVDGYCTIYTPTTPVVTVIDCLFNWGDTTDPTLLAPRGVQSQVSGPYYYRYYSGTGSYVGVSSTDKHLYYIGPGTGSTLTDLGPASNWYKQSNCVSSTPAIQGTPRLAVVPIPVTPVPVIPVPDTTTSTASITNYMSAAYSADQFSFSSDATAVVRQVAPRQGVCSGSAYIGVKDLKISHVQTFVTNVVAAVQASKSAGYGIDKSAIISLFNGYQNQDLAWLASYTWSNCAVSQGLLDSLATTFVPAVNSAYSGAIAAINAM